MIKPKDRYDWKIRISDGFAEYEYKFSSPISTSIFCVQEAVRKHLRCNPVTGTCTKGTFARIQRKLDRASKS